jgi:hypothetical protein
MSAQPQALEMSAPERLLRDDLEQGPFMAGCDRGYWRLVDLRFPNSTISVSAAPRPGGPDDFALWFDFSGYPEAPTARLWDLVNDTPLSVDRWPAGGPRVMAAFNPGWKTDALYIPVDRVALQGHEAWLTRYAGHVWDPASDLTQYLRLVHGMLNDSSYTGCRG